MKFTIITPAVHKLKDTYIYAYEPYVREMNLWLKYVDEVQIVAPISEEKVTSIESKYQFNKHHNEQGEAISPNKKIATLHTPRNDENKRHSEQGEAILSNEKIATSHTPRNDETNRHPQLDWGSHDSDHKKQIPNQVGNNEIKLIPIHSFDVTTLKNGIKAIFRIPKILIQIYKAMQWADHIHLRCPGNIGLLGCFVQILFPNKPKTVKYAGNWDPKSKQPLSYRLQKWIVSKTFLTRNTKVLVYGEWENQTKNIVPFFTATYSEEEILERHSEHNEATSPIKQIATSRNSRTNETDCRPEPVEGFPCNNKLHRNSQLDWRSHDLENDGQIPNQVGNDGKINFLFVGGLTKGKQPLLSMKVVHELKKKGYQVQLDLYGEGTECEKLVNYIQNNSLENEMILHGNTSKEIIKKAYQKAQFLLFISKSEGWPKVVAEAMFWGCLPITSAISCIPYMLDHGNRGAIVTANVDEIILVVEDYLKDTKKYSAQVKKAMEWSRHYTLERFEEGIGKLLNKTSFSA
ncbi:MAG: hypothetical protein COC22_02765 [Flavobacteriaceae bacterium]|nr:MAG: hypothetical protein COC22_02765 [Flavobacteriaceae bacterium]